MRAELRLALLAAAAVGTVAGAVPVLPTPAVRPSPATRDAIALALERGQANDCAGALAAVDPVVPALAPGKERDAVQLIRLNCPGRVGRVAELAATQKELAATIPDNPVVRSFGVLVAAGQSQYDVAAERLASFAEQDPTHLTYISGDAWRGIAQKLTEEKKVGLRDRVFIALARADWAPDDQPGIRDGVAQGAIEALLGRREAPEAEELLPRVTAPELLADMATQRRYQPLWPQIEARLGPRSASAVDRFAADKLDAAARAPGDPRARAQAVRAFVLLGRGAEAIEVAAPIKVATGIGEDDVLAVRYAADALVATGQRDAGLDRLRPFATVDLAATPDAASGLVALAEMLDEAGREEEALTVARATIAKGKDALSPWGEAWVRRTELCALAALGRQAEARPVGDALKAAAEQNQAAAIEGLMCAGRADEAAALAVATLATPEGVDQLAAQFQPEGTLWMPAQSRLRALWTALLARPAVKAAFERGARVLPKAVWPSREPRPIPRNPDDTVPTT